MTHNNNPPFMNDVNTAHHRANHLIADATIHAISDCQAREEGEDEAKSAMVESANNTIIRMNKQTTSLTTSTTAQAEMITILQRHRICAMRNKLDLKRARR